MKVEHVDRAIDYVEIIGDFWNVGIRKGKVVTQTGFLNPVEQKKVHHMYHAIINEATNHTAPKGTLD